MLNPDSILRRLPKLDEKNLLVLDSLRFIIEMLSFSYEKFEELVLDLSIENKEKEYAPVFFYCWSIIDNSRRFIRLYKQLPTRSGHKLVKKIEYVNKPRNTFQHIDERIDETLIDSKQPFFGTLKWIFHDHKSKTIESFVAVSGIHYSESHKFKVVDYNERLDISDIVLTTVDKKRSAEVNLSELKQDIVEIIASLENELLNQFSDQGAKLIDWSRKRDILFKFKNN